jgi:hypothetical protein
MGMSLGLSRIAINAGGGVLKLFAVLTDGDGNVITDTEGNAIIARVYRRQLVP